MISLRTGAALIAAVTAAGVLMHVGRTAETARCAQRGPTAIGAQVTPAERTAVPLATQGQAFISIASADRVIVLDLATGERTNLEAGINEPHEVAVSPDGRWGVAADLGDHTGDYDFDGRELAVYDLREKWPNRSGHRHAARVRDAAAAGDECGRPLCGDHGLQM